MKTYEVKAWIFVQAADEAGALAKAEALLDKIDPDILIVVEGEGAVYAFEEEER